MSINFPFPPGHPLGTPWAPLGRLVSPRWDIDPRPSPLTLLPAPWRCRAAAGLPWRSPHLGRPKVLKTWWKHGETVVVITPHALILIKMMHPIQYYIYMAKSESASRNRKKSGSCRALNLLKFNKRPGQFQSMALTSLRGGKQAHVRHCRSSSFFYVIIIYIAKNGG